MTTAPRLDRSNRPITVLNALLLAALMFAASCSGTDDANSEATDADAATTEVASEPDTETSETESPPRQLRIATYNAGLAEGFVPLAEERLPLVAEAIADLDADIVFLQEIWATEAVDALRTATNSSFTTAIFPEPIPDTELGEPACTIEELADLQSCIATNCADASPDELVGCVLVNCGAPFAGLCDECRNCITANVGSTVAEAIANCTTASSLFAYEGSLGIGLLSTADIVDTDVLVLESSINRRAVLHALVDTEAFGPIHVFGTHLSAVFSDIPFPGDGSWEGEQASQIEALLAYIETRVDSDDPVVLLGDFNTGPSGVLFEAEVAANYELLSAAMFTNTYIETIDARCTFCGDNPLVGGGDGVVIDHVFTRGLQAGSDAERIFDQPLTLDVDGEATTTALSDHYGVVLTLTEMR